jgi:hypothetical protein
MGHEDNGHRDYKRPLLNGKLYISGSETASANPGYMEGGSCSQKYHLNFNKKNMTLNSFLEKLKQTPQNITFKKPLR